MKAAVWTGVDKIEIKDIPMPTLNEGEALIKVRVAGVCVTDYHVISGKLKIGVPPNVQGHEICGEIVKINGESSLKIGERCVIATSLGCGECEYCKQGKQYICNQSSEIGYSPHNGGYEEYLKVPIQAIVPIPDSVSDLSASVLESWVCPTESLMNVGVKKGSTVLVTGNGPAALAYITIAKYMGAEKVISVIRSEDKEHLVKDFGATHVINTKKCYAEQVLNEITLGDKCELVIEATGAPSVIENCFNYVKKGGKVILYGIPGDDVRVNLPVKKIICEEISIHGAVGNTKAWKPLVDLIDKGAINLDKMVTHKFKLDDIDKAFDLYRNHDREIIKAVIEF
ncbi:MAG: alcohol dehydrogenase catalytic domain-containing protein [Clostridia bacterium]|nr:alcohol dehydrogenase catalytic domain-containing protein [Clostridia bacterium]